MTSEQHPETGVITYSRFDARGHAGRMQRGPNDLTTTWDRAERVTQVRETSGQQRVLKEFTFATSNAGGGANLRRGKLITATRHNWIPVPWAGGAVTDVTVTENYTYEGRGGRASQRTTAVSTGPTFSQGWTYTDFGDVENLTYPRCTQSSCTTAPTSGSPRTVTFGYTRAELSSVSGYASSIDYHPSGLVNTVAHSNGVNEITDADPDGMRRPEEIRTTGATSASLGVHRYDGAGNVVARGAEYYLYDLVSRLARYNTTTSSYQTYGYDTYSNMTSLNFFNGSTTTTRGFSINVATNQLSGAATYDTAGNLTSWGGHTYGYDAFNMQTTHDFPDWVQLYTADDERIVSLRYTGTSPIEETYTLRDLGGKALTSYKAIGGNTGTWYWEKDYVYRDGLLLAAESSEPWPKNQQHYVVDHLGTPRLVTGANGSAVAIHHYFGFGEEIGGGSDPERLRFTGHERDFHEAGTEDDLDYMHARYCSPQLARFMSVDPARASAEQKLPQSWNRYAYARGNPVKFTDPDGRYVESPIDLAVLAVDIGIAAYETATAGSISPTTTAAISADLPTLSLPGAAGGGFFFRAAGAVAHSMEGVARAARGLQVATKTAQAGEAIQSSSLEKTPHREQRASEAKAGDTHREVGDVNHVVGEGRRFLDTRTGNIVVVKGDRVVVLDKSGRQVSQFRNTRRNTNQRIQDGRWQIIEETLQRNADR
ncbi:MAG: hypothetical protein HC897_13305 [Thermoanaerobaculia bacterium]|nr:hypothetical protein [Thermoanaerobaculia bacterium]